MPQPTIIIRDPTPADEMAWRELWSQYNAFYEVSIPEAVTARTWQRVLDPASTVFGRLAIADSEIAGFSVSLLHESTWTIGPACYLEDLFVAPKFRGRGIGRLLIQELVDRAKSNGWSRLYWHTRANNPARRLYDEFAEADDFVRYRKVFPENS
ncbi:MAG TPA: GNAT family N-acetyltransferase [Xanthobacteraceae bacterium]|nr:GNAT family N-acetyltransferase [Xanthobacteraceae bacterium]